MSINTSLRGHVPVTSQVKWWQCQWKC